MNSLGFGFGVDRLRGGGVGVASAPSNADFIVTNDAEWDAAIAAVAPGETIEIQGTNFTAPEINSVDKGGKFTITSQGAGAYLPSIVVRNSNNLRFKDFNVIHTAWPKTVTALFSMPGNLDNIEFDGLHIAHGYGNPTDPRVIANGGLPVPFDTAAELPEYTRTTHILDATAVSSAHALTWEDPSAPNWGRVSCFNNGTEDVFVKLGGDASVVATSGDTLVPVGATLTVLTKTNYLGSGVTTLPTHIAAISASGTQSFEARTEIGLVQYLASAFAKDGSGILTNVDIRNCHIHDVADGFKFGYKGVGLFFNNLVERAYQDAFSYGGGNLPPTSHRVLRNVAVALFAAGGTGQVSNGDASDPHADMHQLFGNDFVDPVTPVDWDGIESAGNLYIRGDVREAAGGQGDFFSDMPEYPDGGFINTYILGNLNTGGAGRGVSITGEDIFVFECDAFADNRPSSNSSIIVAPIRDSLGYVGNSIAQQILGPGGTTAGGNLITPLTLENNVVIDGVTNTFANVFTQPTPAPTNLSEGLIAWEPLIGGPAVGIGAIGATVIDYATNDPEQVIKWDMVPTKWRIKDVTNQPLSTLTATSIGRVMGGPLLNQTVVADAGTEYRITSDKAGLVLITDWASVAGTINQGQFIQLRGTTSGSNATSVTVGVTINGYSQTTNLITASAPFEVTTVDAATNMVGTGAMGPETAATKFLIAFRAAPDALNGNFSRIMKSQSNKFDINSLASGTLLCDVNGTDIRFRCGSGLSASGGGPATTICSIDTSAETLEEGVIVYRDAVRTTAFSSATWLQNASVDFSTAAVTYVFDQTGTGVNPWIGEFEMFYFNPVTGDLPDITDPNVRAKFTKDFLAADGSGPTGSQPYICLFGDAAKLSGADNNTGSAHDFTVNGSITDVP